MKLRYFVIIIYLIYMYSKDQFSFLDILATYFGSRSFKLLHVVTEMQYIGSRSNNQ